MTLFALKALAARKLRAFLTPLAIVLGVAMVSGTYVLTDTIDKAFDAIFASSYDRTDAVVTGGKTVEWSESGRLTVPETVLAKVRALPEVDEATGALVDFSGDSDQAQLLDKQGEPIQNGNPTFGFGVDPHADRFNPFELAGGRWATADDEVVVDAETTAKYGYRVGETIRVAAQGPVRSFRIVGTATLGDVDTVGGATIAIFTVRTAQRLHRKQGFDSILIAADKGVSQSQLLAAVGDAVPSSLDVRSGSDQAAQDAKGVGEFVSFIRYFLLGFGGIALFVGAFVIFNTLSITVAQRTRELATLRTLGASRRQVLRSVVAEGLAIGLIGSLVGVALGVAIARGLAEIFAALDLQLPQSDLVFHTRTAVVPLVLGTGITLLACLVPAIRATRVPAIAAVREGANLASPRLSKRVTAAAITIAAVAGASVAYGLLGHVSVGQRILMLVGGTLGLFLGVAMLAPRLVRPLATVVGQPSVRLGGAAGRLARENAVRNPGRTATTAAALMIGLTLVTFVSVLGKGMLASGKTVVSDQTRTNYVVTSKTGWETVPVDAGRAVARARGVEVASSVRYDQARAAGGTTDVSGVDPRTIARTYRFDWIEGSDATVAALGRDSAVVRKSFAKDKDLDIGSVLTLTTPLGRSLSVDVVGIYDAPDLDPLLASVVISQEAFDAHFERPSDTFTLVQAPSREAIDRAIAAFPTANVQTIEEFADARHEFLSSVMNLFYVLLGLSVIVSLFGMVNTLVLAVFERTRELGMLRAIGMTRRQVRRMIRHEGVITSLIGAGIGLPLGVALAALVIQPLRKFGVSFSLPLGSLVLFFAVAAVAGFVAATLPARRASRLNVLEALQYE